MTGTTTDAPQQPPEQPPPRTEKKAVNGGLVQRLEFDGDMVEARGVDGSLVASYDARTLQQLELAPPEASLDAVVRRVSTTLLTEVTNTSVTTQKEIASGFRNFRLMIWTLFVVGVVGFCAALIRGWRADTGPEVAAAAVFGGLSVTSFVAVFLNQPVRAMSKAGPDAAWLLAIVNTYWTKLAYLNNPETVVQDLDAAQTSMGKALTQYLKATAEHDPKVTAAKVENRRTKKKQKKQKAGKGARARRSDQRQHDEQEGRTGAGGHHDPAHPNGQQHTDTGRGD